MPAEKSIRRQEKFRAYCWERFIPYRFPFLILFHLFLFVTAYVISYNLRFEGLIPEAYMRIMLRTLPWVVLVQGVIFYYYDLFRGLWRYVSFPDIKNIIEANLISGIIMLNANLLFHSYFGHVPYSIYVLDFLLVVAFTGGCRLLVRYAREKSVSLSEPPQKKRVILVGPLQVVEPLLREMHSYPNNYVPVVLIDPESNFYGSRIHNVLIGGGLSRMVPLIKRYRIQEIIFVWLYAPEITISNIVKELKYMGITFKIIPSLKEVLGGHFRLEDLRDIDLEDLLPRPPIYVDRENISEFIRARVVLVTGAGGSIGSEICRQVAGFYPRQLVLLDRAENLLYEIEVALRQQFPKNDFQILVGSINDGPGLAFLFQQYRPDLVFHAAAYKHVPLMERCPLEAAYNNILGTRNLVKAALAGGTERFVMISTDKAVNPSSVMGVSKHIAEQYVQSLNNSRSTRFLITRFGNVLGSAGSVVPVFKKQLMDGGPLTITHPEIERFFMTIPEAVQLVLQAAYMGEKGDIFVLNMGRSVKIQELAEKLAMLAGKTLGKDIEVSYVGLRPGEKLSEELFNSYEQPYPTEHPMILRAVGQPRTPEVWEAHLDEIAGLVLKRDINGLMSKFKSIVPSYSGEVPAEEETALLPH